MCCGIYIELVNGKLAKNATMDPVFLVLKPKNPYFYGCADVDMSAPAKKGLRWHRHIKTDFNQKSENLGMISARHTTKKQSFKKVTCPFKIK